MLLSEFFSSSPPPPVSANPFSMSVPLFLPCRALKIFFVLLMLLFLYYVYWYWFVFILLHSKVHFLLWEFISLFDYIELLSISSNISTVIPSGPFFFNSGLLEYLKLYTRSLNFTLVYFFCLRQSLLCACGLRCQWNVVHKLAPNSCSTGNTREA